MTEIPDCVISIGQLFDIKYGIGEFSISLFDEKRNPICRLYFKYNSKEEFNLQLKRAFEIIIDFIP